MTTKEFLQARKNETLAINEVLKNEFGPLENDIFNAKPEPKKWSVAECVQHLNMTLKIYIPQLVLVVQNKHLNRGQKEYFKHSFLGKMAVKSMDPKDNNEISMKIKTFKILKPASIEYQSKEVLDKFIGFQDDILFIINDCGDMSLEKPKINTAIGPLLKMRFGDALHFMVAHNRRHILQAQNVLRVIG